MGKQGQAGSVEHTHTHARTSLSLSQTHTRAHTHTYTFVAGSALLLAVKTPLSVGEVGSQTSVLQLRRSHFKRPRTHTHTHPSLPSLPKKQDTVHTAYSCGCRNVILHGKYFSDKTYCKQNTRKLLFFSRISTKAGDFTQIR